MCFGIWIFHPLVFRTWIFCDTSFWVLISIIQVRQRLHIWSEVSNTTPWYNDLAQHLNINTGQMTFQPKEWGGVDDIWQCGLQLGKLTQGRDPELYIIQSNFTVGNIWATKIFFLPSISQYLLDNSCVWILYRVNNISCCLLKQIAKYKLS